MTEDTAAQETPTMVVAIPTMGEGGFECERSGHFGHCDCFTVVDVEGSAAARTRVVANPPHGSGGCLEPVGRLAAEGVTAIIVGGMGARPLAGFVEAGIDVYYEPSNPRVGDALEMLLAGELPQMEVRNACGGGGGHCS